MWKDSDKLVEKYNCFVDGGAKVPFECPECNSKAVHIYIHSHDSNHCGIWIWCSECGAFAHMSGQTPEWWKNPVFIDGHQLCSEPDYLETKAIEIDEWVNSFSACKRNKSQQNVIVDRFNVRLTTDIQDIPSGTEGVIVIKNDFKTVKVQFISKDGATTNILLDHAELIKSVEIL